MDKKILVMGAAGMAGHIIALYFKERGYDVTGFARRDIPYCPCIKGDARNAAAVEAAVANGWYDAVINCIGVLNQFAEADKASTVYLNGFLPHYLADLSRKYGFKLLHMSTDCVFAGNGGPYTEESFPDGRSFYDRTKAIGEVNDHTNLTFRNSIVGPDPNEKGIGLFNWFMKQQGSISGYTGAIWTGVTTLTLAKAMEQALNENLTGLYNLVNNDSISKYDLLQLFNKYFRNGEIEILPSDKLQLDKTLHRLRNDFSFVVPSYEQQVAEMRDWVYSHKDIYPHYFSCNGK